MAGGPGEQQTLAATWEEANFSTFDVREIWLMRGKIQYSVLEGAAEIGMLSGIVGRSPAGEDVYRGEDAES